ncbi:TGS domain-containing protein [Candidatus Bathyarchaeota archaeon]|nr:MAG: TGS domain-containing protein [Candidatus Bathyarchaeota archaeon]
MVTNLPAEAKAKWAEVVACKSIPEKIRLMREFLSLVPKHKGTSNLLANVRRRIAILERELERKRTRRKGGYGGFSVPKEGAGQIVILGPTNVGRSSLLVSVTSAKAEVSPVYFATRKPIVGMLPYHDIQFQLVEAPALVEGSAEGRMNGPQILGLARNADGLILMVDLSSDPIGEFRMLSSELEQAGIMTEKPEGEVEIIRRGVGAGLQIIGGGVLVGCTPEDVKRLLANYRINSALIRIRGKVTLENIEESLFSSLVYRPAILVANKLDVEGARENLARLKEYMKDSEIPIIPVSCKNNEGLENLGDYIFKMLRIIRVYPKEPGEKKPSPKPLVIDEGTTVIEAAKKLHSKLYREFKYARIWGPSAKYPGQRVGPTHVLKDGDIIEIR